MLKLEADSMIYEHSFLIQQYHLLECFKTFFLILQTNLFRLYYQSESEENQVCLIGKEQLILFFRGSLC